MSLLTLFSWWNIVVRVKARFAVRRAQVARLTVRDAVIARLTVRGDDRL